MIVQVRSRSIVGRMGFSGRTGRKMGLLRRFEGLSIKATHANYQVSAILKNSMVFWAAKSGSGRGNNSADT